MTTTHLENNISILFIESSTDDIMRMITTIEKIGYTVRWKKVENEITLRMALSSDNWNLIICDYKLPRLTAEKALDICQEHNPEIPFLVVSGTIEEDVAYPLVESGAIDFIGKDRLFRLPLAIKREMRNVSKALKQKFILDQSFNAIVTAWGTAMELRDKKTAGHTIRTAEHAMAVAYNLGVPQEVIRKVYFGAIVHDVGKIAIPDRVLLKPGKLTEEELDIMKSHATIGYEFLKDIPLLKDAAMVAYCHHERWDGSGYPRGLSGRDIPIEARIFALVDVYDALVNDRPYRSALTRQKALEEMEKMKSGFDPDIYRVFISLPGEL